MKKLLLFSVALSFLLAGCSKTGEFVDTDNEVSAFTFVSQEDCDVYDFTSPCGSNGAYAIVRGGEYYFKSITLDPGTEFEETNYWTITDLQSTVSTGGFAVIIPEFAGQEVDMTFFSVWRHETHTFDQDGYCYVGVSRWGGFYEQIHIRCPSVSPDKYILHIDFGWRPF
ncbi:MAG: hypothetical protein LIO77_09310 [Rikenellaceae bacterium]|nr:hypothetical protein [Rikenellaceae bacterium]